jgi:2-polyprenyl-3-methyl-5-hydroxy-6-metoxy-1,4-benzoquinol methylase
MTQTSLHANIETTRTETFDERLLRVLNDGALCLMLSLGHRTGLFDAMSQLRPATAEEIAQAAKLNTRYVREWLGAMVTGRVVVYDPATERYQLPAEHADFLTRASGANNMAVFAQYIGGLGFVEDAIVECFQNGGGVPYEKFPRFHEVMAEDSGQSVLSSLESHVLPLVPGLADRLERGIRVLDLGCGRGRILHRLATRYPKSRFTGIDLSEEAIAYARAHVAGLENVEYVARDMTDFDLSAEADSFDLITTFDAIHDQARPLSVLVGIHRALASDGVYVMQDISGTGHLDQDIEHPLGTLLYTVSCMHCMTVSLAQGGEGLGAMWGEEKTMEYLRRAGFTSISVNRLEHDVQNNWYVVRK